ncbi:TetR family transcriptional regulator [Oerskovia sp. Root918]|uniref:HTH-type transcriptional repressor ComR n=1 Tax=Oerskovia enterophila TaxID=43678 RepID=A0A161YH44_9CELL|nr:MULTISPECIES: TetR/AcrR family transcriptional regulator [Oerskovia]KRC35713.1 TetR family transcriptional regulator [Oerskovia sp. Root22]KRD36360.1 TetR family transcriptional regulator [Oerskovia sp. Root918]KZM35388.1 HTH-type transcriptional repressor ComR [Oerskovia enterophila]
MPVPELAPLTPGARRVLDAASRLFYERGIHSVGVDTIAESAGVTKKTLYDRFGSKEALVVAYLQHRDARWRGHVEAHLALVPEPGVDRVLAIFDAAVSWSDENSPKGCSAINARAEIGDGHDGHPVFPEVSRQKAWLLGQFADLCREADLQDPSSMARAMMLLYEGAIVTVGMETFAHPFERARTVARILLESQPPLADQVSTP